MAPKFVTDHRLVIDQLVVPIAFFFALEDCSGIIVPEADFYDQITG